MELAVAEKPSIGWGRRLMDGMWRHKARSLVCPEAPRLDGQLALVTGGNAGIGLGTCRGLLQRGAQVVMASRNAGKAERACAGLREELGAEARVSFAHLDLGDLASVRDAAEALGGRRFDMLACNAGVLPQRRSTSPQGHELAFATNVLGHFLLLRHLMNRGLADNARVVIVTGDIYILARDCTSDYAYRTRLGGMGAYCRSKLGDLWLADQLQRRHPQLHVLVAHPGAVASELGGGGSGLMGAFQRRTLLDANRGAQTSLYCLTQPGLPKGAYLHNTSGLMLLRDEDPARNTAKAAELWQRCETLCKDYLPLLTA